MLGIQIRFKFLLLFTLVVPVAESQGTGDGPVVVKYPNTIVPAAGPNGHIYLKSGSDGDIVFKTNATNSVYFEGNDLHQFVTEVTSSPPIWTEHSPFGYLGRFVGGQIVSIQLHATDPEGGPVTYNVISGSFPPGISFESSSGRIHGLIPDAKALFQFTIRATDNHGKFADLSFKMDVGEKNSCKKNTCQHEGICKDTSTGFQCSCVHPYGGTTCNIDCRNNYLGIDYNKRYIPNAQLTGYKSVSGYYPYNARLNQHAWIGVDGSSWIQVDLGNRTRVYGSIIQGYSTTVYTSQYSLQYSLDGNHFQSFTDPDGKTLVFNGHGSTSAYTSQFNSAMVARFVRFIPVSWRTNYHPGMGVELLGCHE